MLKRRFCQAIQARLGKALAPINDGVRKDGTFYLLTLRLVPVFPQPVQALNNQTVKVQGFMMPLEPGERQKHFLLTSVPMTCSFCVPGGPESMVEVKTKVPVKYTLEPVVVEGKFAVLNDDPYGLYYRITDAVGVK